MSSNSVGAITFTSVAVAFSIHHSQKSKVKAVNNIDRKSEMGELLLPFEQPSEIVEKWTRNLPLASMLGLCLRPAATLQEVATLTKPQIKEICRRFAAKLEVTLETNCSLLKSALANETHRQTNSKFGTYEGNFGTISSFHTQLYDEIGNPNPNWELAMRTEHESNMKTFTSGNYGITTCPRAEWSYVVDGATPPVEAMGHGRVLQSIDSLMTLDVASQAQLTRAEVISLALYTGPMFVIYNTILRKYPTDRYGALKDKDSFFATSIFVLVSAIQKVSRVMVLRPGQSLYRGVDGNMNLPPHFSTPDPHGCVGMMEFGFMSTTADLKMAVSYSGVDKGKAHPKVLEIKIGSVDRGADIHEFSQYPGEAEYLWAPHAFLEPVGGNETLVTEHGVVEVIKVRANANLKAVTLEEYEVRKKEMHLASFKILLQDLQLGFDKMVSEASMKKDEAVLCATNCLTQCEEVRMRHEAKPATEYNDDTVYRRLVTEMLDAKTHALVKLEYLLLRSATDNRRLGKPLSMAYRDFMMDRSLAVAASPHKEMALDLCKKYGLVMKDVEETNELGETPLIAACADGVTYDKLKLLLLAGCDVNASVSYPGVLGKCMTPLLTASLYGRSSLVRLLVDHKADVNAVSGAGDSAVYFAALCGHVATAEVLVALGCDVNLPSGDGTTAVYSAARRGHTAMVAALHRLGADITRANREGTTPLSRAARDGHTATVELLCGLGADVNEARGDGVTPLQVATRKGHEETVRALLRFGALA